MEKLKSIILNNKFNLIILLMWSLTICFSILHHEIWRDEAQAWCIVRDLGLFDILKMSKTEGHPLLWYLILFPAAKTGLSVISMQIISFILIFISVCFLLFKSPFNKFEKLIIIFSAGMIYYLPVVARNYALIPVFIYTAAYFYPKRKEKPFLYVFSIALLSYTHLYMLGFCLVLSFIFFIEKLQEYYQYKNFKVFIPFVILFFSFLSLFLTFFKFDNYALESEIRMGLSLIEVLKIVAKIYTYNLFMYGGGEFAKNHFDIISIILFYPFLIIILLSFLKTNKKIGLACFCGILYMFFVFSKVFFNGILYQKAYLIFLILIFCFWNIKKGYSLAYKAGLWSFYSLFIISCLISPFVIYEDFKYNFSGGKQIAQYIKENLDEENTFIAVGNPFLYSCVSAYLPDKKLYNVISESYISYYSYSKNNKKQNILFPENSRYSIVQENVDVSQNPYLSFVFKGNEENISSKTEREVFSIYVQK